MSDNNSITLKGKSQISMRIGHPPNTRLELQVGPLMIWHPRKKCWKDADEGIEIDNWLVRTVEYIRRVLRI